MRREGGLPDQAAFGLRVVLAGPMPMYTKAVAKHAVTAAISDIFTGLSIQSA